MVHSKRWSMAMVPLAILACSVIGGLYGPSPHTEAKAAQDEIQDSVRAFATVYSSVEQSFADKISADTAIYRGAIPGMLRTLDPHSSFFDPREFRLLREEQKGQYYGVGMSVAPHMGRTIVIAPFPGSPAYRAGIRPGDVIVAVDDKPTDNLSTSAVADLLKGRKGTEVKISIVREGSDEPLHFKVVRDEIPRKSVQEAFWIKPGIAYLRIENFNENTSREVNENFARLGEDRIQGLILDMRGNPGGLLSEGVAVADRFLKKGQVIVSHRGRASAERPYKAKQGSRSRDYPIVVLVSRSSASASEIVAGALQDHDRAWVLGENTFGKALVQTVYPLAENTGLALTTARYYTPSGRLIQRDYNSMSFIDYYYNRKNLESKNLNDVKMTDSGRTVFGGGGIAPDEKIDELKLNRLQIRILQRHGVLNFTSGYVNGHGPQITAEWEPDHIVLNEFHRFLLKEGFEFSEAEFAEISDWAKQQIRREVFISRFGIDEAQKMSAMTDPVVAKAIEALPKAKSLLQDAEQVVSQRSARND